MNDRDLLEALDRRAASASTSLDARLAEVDPPDLELPGGRSVLRRLAPLTLVAAVLAVAVGATGLRAGDDEGETTLAGDQAGTHLVLPKPAEAGFNLTVAFDGTPSPGGGQPQDVPITVQGPDNADDPWASSLVEYALPMGSTTRSGDAVDIGGPAASVEQGGMRATITWDDGDVVRFLVSTRLSLEELTSLARHVVADATEVGAPISGQRVLFAGDTSDVFPVLVTRTTNEEGISGVAYGTESDPDDGMVIASVSGDETRWQAAQALATAVDETTVRGNDAMIATFGLGVLQVSWLEDNGTLVRVEALDGDVSDLVPLLDQLVAVDDDAFTELVRNSPGADEAPPARFAPGGVERAPGALLASVRSAEGERALHAAVVRQESGDLVLNLSVQEATGESSTVSPLSGIDANVAMRQPLDGDGEIVAGLVGPSVVHVEVRDPSTGELPEGEGPSTATLEDSSHVLFMARIDPGWAGTPLVVVGTTAAGDEVSIPL